MRKFWKWKNRMVMNQETMEPITERTLFLNGTIAEESWFDDDITPRLFKDELESGSGDIVVWINSPGGDCVAAAQIYNMLMDYKGNVTVKIDGIAASAASVIAMAGATVLVSPVSMLMIHNPMTAAFGDKTEMEKAISMLAEVKESIINAYEIKTGLSRAKISHLMDDETWMDAHKAIELGFADDMLSRPTLAFPDKDDDEEDEEDTDKEDGDEDKDEDDEERKKSTESMLYSRTKVYNSLMEKIAKKCRIESKKTKKTVNSDALMERLNLLKTWR